MVFMLVCLGTR